MYAQQLPGAHVATSTMIDVNCHWHAMFDHELAVRRTASPYPEHRSMHEDSHGTHDAMQQVALARSDQIGVQCLGVHHGRLIPSMG